MIEKKKLKESVELLVNIDKKSSIIDDIPIEILIYCLLNYVPSPFYRDIEIKLLDIDQVRWALKHIIEDLDSPHN